jgi:acetyl esterase/lipase
LGVSSYAAMDTLIQYFVDESTFPNVKNITLMGHSAGGQVSYLANFEDR